MSVNKLKYHIFFPKTNTNNSFQLSYFYTIEGICKNNLLLLIQGHLKPQNCKEIIYNNFRIHLQVSAVLILNSKLS